MLLTVDDKSDEAYRRFVATIQFNKHPENHILARRVFAEDVAAWIDDWAVSYNPKELDFPSQPFQLSDHQRELVAWLEAVVERREEAVLEKGRDLGVSWVFAFYALNKFLFVPGFKTTYASYDASKVDQLGDPDSWFEKVRTALDRLPRWQLPSGWDRMRHDNHMRLVNPENGNTITGEVGKNMGRGGRSTLAIVDEAAFVERASEAARSVSENSDAKVWASTANGMATLFYRKREAVRTRDPSLLFRFHWRHDPRKDEAWAERRRASMDPVDWASEHEIDYGASVERQLIKAEWVEACHELAWRHAHEIEGEAISGLDVGAGKAESSHVARRGALVFDVTAWHDPDAVDTAALGLEHAKRLGATTLHYDAVGVGTSQGAIMQRMANGVHVVGINAGEPPPPHIRIDEGDRTVPASDRFANLKALGWWRLRERAKASWERLSGLADHPLGDCLLLGVDDSTLDAQLCQPTWSHNLRGKRQVDKAPDGARSPDRADALVLTVVEVRQVMRGSPMVGVRGL